MFARSAGLFELLYRLMHAGQDVRWRKDVIRLAGLKPQSRLLDLGSGTGDLARTVLAQQPTAHVTAADFTIAMMQAGRKPTDTFGWTSADALALPFSTGHFNAVVSGFLMRNVVDSQAALNEQYRVLQPGGRIVILDTTRPKRNLLSPFIWLHMHFVIPLMGTLVSGQRDAYTYLPESTEAFLTAEGLASRMAVAGFKQIDFKRLMFGTIAIHWGVK